MSELGDAPGTRADRCALPPDEGPLHVAVLFMDLISSSEFAGILGLREYAHYAESFGSLCRVQCDHYFNDYLAGEYRAGRDYHIQMVGDELAVFVHSGNASNDVYQLLCLAISIKCGWLATAHNAVRLKHGSPATDVAAGVHAGMVWASRDNPLGPTYRGIAINIGKRVETASREGSNFRVFLSDAAFKHLSRRVRHMLVGERRVLAMKGVVLPEAVRELRDSFVGLHHRLAPALLQDFRAVAAHALARHSFDAWVHSCLQTTEEAERGRVTDECLDLCRQMLAIDPGNPVALYFAAQGQTERGEIETACLLLRDLTAGWPTFADGWLELGRGLKRTGDLAAARHAILQARRYGVTEAEESLPDTQH